MTNEAMRRATLPAVRERVTVSIDRDLLKWIDEHSEPGAPFAGASHAMEVGLRRLRDEEEAVRAACKKAGLSFDPAAFWDIYREHLETSQQNKPGRPRKA